MESKTKGKICRFSAKLATQQFKSVKVYCSLAQCWVPNLHQYLMLPRRQMLCRPFCSHTPVRQNLGLALSPPSSASAPCFNSACELNCEVEGAWRVRMKTKHLGWDPCLKHLWRFDMPHWRWSIPNSSHETGGRKPSDWNSTCKGDLECKKCDRTCKSVKSYHLLQFPGLKKKIDWRRFQVQRVSDLAHRCVPFTRSYQERSGAILAQGIHIGLPQPELRGFSKAGKIQKI